MFDPTAADADAPTPETDRPEDCVAVVVEYDDKPDECTIYPPNATEERLVTTWLSAGGDAFVGLDEMR